MHSSPPIMELPSFKKLMPVVFLTTFAFLLDMMTPLGVALGMFFILPQLATLSFEEPRITLIVTLLGTFLIICGFLLSPEGGETWKVLANRAMALVTIWGTHIFIQTHFQTTRSLRRLHQRLRAFLDTAVDGILTIDHQEIIQDCNPAACRIFGYQEEEMVGQNIKMFMPDYDHGEHDGSFKNHRETGKKSIGIRREVEGKRKDGSIFPIDLSMSEVNVEGRSLFSGIVRDISERKQTEKALRATNEELERFAYIASHDLKAPLRVIDNASQWLEEDLAEHLTSENRENMALLRGRVRRMENLLDDLLEYSRVGRTTDARYLESVNGAVLVEEILELLAPPEKFTIDVSPAFASIQVVKMPLQQLLLNLVNNALKHHDQTQGTIRLGVQDHGGRYRFTVADDGPGIPPAFHHKIFEMFQTLKPRDQVEGSGMGLAVVKKYVDLVGGAVHLDSIEGKGSTFTVLWPKAHTMEEQTA